MTQKSLSVPLHGGPYKVADVSRIQALRKYGPRWTAEVCAIGRAVTLSSYPLNGVIDTYSRTNARFLSKDYQEAVQCHYGTLDIEVAVIGINIKE